jgi:putative N6-adenine-specific DNA methylase
MLEALAASTVMATKWDRKSPFVNPMCGSGTVAIEAAMMATNRRPVYTEELFIYARNRLRCFFLLDRIEKLQEQIIDVSGLRIIATDISEDAIKISKVNAGIAGVESVIEFTKCDFEETPVPETGGVGLLQSRIWRTPWRSFSLRRNVCPHGRFLKKEMPGVLWLHFYRQPRSR